MNIEHRLSVKFYFN